MLLRHRPLQPVELEQRELELIRILEMNIFTSAALNARSGSQVQELRAVEGEGSSAEWNASEGNNEERRTRPRTDDDDVTSLVGTARTTSRTPRGHGAQGPGRTTARTAPSSSSGAAPSTGGSTLTETTVWRGALREPPPAEEEEPTCADEAISRCNRLAYLGSTVSRAPACPQQSLSLCNRMWSWPSPAWGAGPED